MDSFECPFCHKINVATNDTYRSENVSFSNFYDYENFAHDSAEINLTFCNCASCEKISIYVQFVGEQFPNKKTIFVYPSSRAKQFPEYIPRVIRSDYEEAFTILELSPKSSATLSRRCIQGMIRDVWKVSESSLYKEIDAIRDKIDATLWTAINALRQLGNIGAHMEKEIDLIIDIEPDEAEKLLHLVEILIKEWYINPHERDLLLGNIVNINDEKQALRKS